jgi:hypothetical protein
VTSRVDGSYSKLVALVAKEMHSDDEDQSEMLANLYLSANDAEKAVLDSAFICLCGWSLKTLISKAA